MAEYTIYDSSYLVMMDEDELENLMREVGCEDCDKWQFIADENQDAYDALMDNCRHVSGEFLVIADLGLWFGRRMAWKFCSNLRDAILACVDGMDDFRIVEDGRGKVTLYGYHHDGTNVYEIRKVAGEISSATSEKSARKHSRNAHLRREFGWI